MPPNTGVSRSVTSIHCTPPPTPMLSSRASPSPALSSSQDRPARSRQARRAFRSRKVDIAYCYGTLYHLRDPDGALARLAAVCEGQVLVETLIVPGDYLELHFV